MRSISCSSTAALFQGFKALRLKNWAPFPVEPRSIDAVILTHAHLDHSGYLPLLIKRGFRGPVFCSRATADLCAILLPDAGHLQEKDAEFANRHGFSKHKPALPLYTEEDAQRGARAFAPIPFDQDRRLAAAAARSGSGAPAISSARHRSSSTGPVSPRCLLRRPRPIRRSHHGRSGFGRSRRLSAGRVRPTATGDTTSVIRRRPWRRSSAPRSRRGGTVIIPAFAVGRAQSLLSTSTN